MRSCWQVEPLRILQEEHRYVSCKIEVRIRHLLAATLQWQGQGTLMGAIARRAQAAGLCGLRGKVRWFPGYELAMALANVQLAAAR